MHNYIHEVTLIPFLNQSAIFVGSGVGFLNVFSYMPAEPPPRRLDIIFDLEMSFIAILWP
jgi:hypothetical protein